MRKIAAHLVYSPGSDPVPKGTLVLDNQGTVVDLIAPETVFRESAGVEFYSGLVCPAFVPFEDTATFDLLFLHFPELLPFRHQFCPSINTERAILNWAKAILEADNHFTLYGLLTIFCLKMAELTNQDSQLGSFHPGKKPGVLLISGILHNPASLAPTSMVRRLA